ncbi:hypothetical protein Tco_0918157, partial [Tanacetum coccineum]
TCFFSSLMSPDNSLNFEGFSLSLVGKQLPKSCEAKSFENSAHPSRTEVNEPKPLTLEFEPILEMEDDGLKCLQVSHPDNGGNSGMQHNDQS